jgi:hypothetical protein
VTLWRVMDAAYSSEMLVANYQTQCHMSDDHHFKNHHHENLMSHISVPRRATASNLLAPQPILEHLTSRHCWVKESGSRKLSLDSDLVVCHHLSYYYASIHRLREISLLSGSEVSGFRQRMSDHQWTNPINILKRINRIHFLIRSEASTIYSSSYIMGQINQ